MSFSRVLFSWAGLVVLFACCASGNIMNELESISLIPNENLTRADQYFPYRRRRYDVDSGIFGSFFHWSSASSSSVAVSSVRTGSFLVPPYAWTAFLDGKTDFTDYSPSPELKGAFLLNSFLYLFERDPEGIIVDSVFLGTRGWSDFKTVSSDDKRVVAAWSTLTVANNASITFSVLSSDVAGYTDFGHSPVSPNSLEFVIEISKWPLRSDKNSLVLSMASASASDQMDTNGRMPSLKVRTNTENLFFELSRSCYASNNTNGTIPDMNFNRRVSLTPFEPWTVGIYAINDILNDVFEGSSSIFLRNVTFPAGMSNIFYDPAVGFGDRSVYTVDIGSLSSPSSLLSLVVILFAFISSWIITQ